MTFTQLPFFQHINWCPDRAELRRFAIAMLIGFAVLGLIAALRAGGFGTGAFVLWAIGLALATGAFTPGMGRFVYLLVYVPTSIIGYFVSSIVLIAIFYLVFTPIGLLLKLLGKDLLRLKNPKSQSNWQQLGEAKDAERYYHQF
ncbi:MAG TPA: SxtJ family membrane protein [Blastocatellia bacterium]|nr:SxtJ family membrane protein [Blastocatellia bacterium]